MTDRMYYQGKEYDLVPKTMKIARMIEAAEQSATLTEAYRRQWEFVQAALGRDVAKEILGTSNIEEVDLNDVVIVYNSIIIGYEREVMAMRRQQEEELLDTPVLNVLDKVSDVVRNASGAVK